jgi:hypothetical protein
MRPAARSPNMGVPEKRRSPRWSSLITRTKGAFAMTIVLLGIGAIVVVGLAAVFQAHRHSSSPNTAVTLAVEHPNEK